MKIINPLTACAIVLSGRLKSMKAYCHSIMFITGFVALQSTLVFGGEGSGISHSFPLNTRAPNKPVNLLPYNGETNVPFQSVLTGSDFNDEGDSHTISVWIIIINNAEGTKQWSGSSYNNLTQMEIPTSIASFMTRYTWKVCYYDNHYMCSEYSEPTWFEIGLPAAPKTTASDGEYNNKIVITWNEVPGAATYKVYRNGNDTTSGYAMISGDLAVTSFSDNSVIPGMLYYYWVQAGKAPYWGKLSTSEKGYALFTSANSSTWKYKDGKKVDVLKGTKIEPSFTPNLADGWKIGLATKTTDGTLTNISGPYELENLKNKNKVWLLKRKKELIIKYKAKKDIFTYKLWNQMPESKIVYLINPSVGNNQPVENRSSNDNILGIELKAAESTGTTGWQILLPVILAE